LDSRVGEEIKMKKITYENLCVGSLFLCMLFFVIGGFSAISYFFIEKSILASHFMTTSLFLSVIFVIVLISLLYDKPVLVKIT